MRINIIAAVARNRAIGKDNKLIYWLPNDLKRFKALTTGHTIIMGRNTYMSLPKGALPNRRNVVLSRTVSNLPGCDCYASLAEALAHCQPDEDLYVIGGASGKPWKWPTAYALPRSTTARKGPMPSSQNTKGGMKWHAKNTRPTRSMRSTMLSLTMKKMQTNDKKVLAMS